MFWGDPFFVGFAVLVAVSVSVSSIAGMQGGRSWAVAALAFAMSAWLAGFAAILWAHAFALGPELPRTCWTLVSPEDQLETARSVARGLLFVTAVAAIPLHRRWGFAATGGAVMLMLASGTVLTTLDEIPAFGGHWDYRGHALTAGERWDRVRAAVGVAGAMGVLVVLAVPSVGSIGVSNRSEGSRAGSGSSERNTREDDGGGSRELPRRSCCAVLRWPSALASLGLLVLGVCAFSATRAHHHDARHPLPRHGMLRFDSDPSIEHRSVSACERVDELSLLVDLETLADSELHAGMDFWYRNHPNERPVLLVATPPSDEALERAERARADVRLVFARHWSVPTATRGRLALREACVEDLP